MGEHIFLRSRGNDARGRVKGRNRERMRGKRGGG